MANYERNIATYLQDIESVYNELAKEYIDEIAENNFDDIEQFIRPGRDNIPLNRLTMKEYSSLKCFWDKNKHVTYDYISDLFLALLRCISRACRSSTSESKRVYRMITDAYVNFIRTTSAYIIMDEDDVSKDVKIYLDLYFLDSTCVKKLLFVADVLTWYSFDGRIEFYHLFSSKDGSDKFSSHWNKSMIYTPETTGELYGKFYRYKVTSNSSYYYFYNPFTKSWYLSLNKCFDNYTIIPSSSEQAIDTRNDFIIIYHNDKYFIAYNDIDTNNEDLWHDNLPYIFKHFIVYKKDDTWMIRDRMQAQSHTMVDADSTEALDILTFSNEYVYDGIGYLVARSRDDKYYIASEKKPGSFYCISSPPQDAAEAYYMYKFI